MAPLDEQDQLQVWSMRLVEVTPLCALTIVSIYVLLFRNVCQKRFPDSLPKLLSSISWNNRSDVAQVYLCQSVYVYVWVGWHAYGDGLCAGAKKAG